MPSWKTRAVTYPVIQLLPDPRGSMRVVLESPEDLKRREFNYVKGTSPDDGGELSRGERAAGLLYEETLSSDQWVDTVVEELKGAALK
eukprot:9228476-Alexandrium_andersonii.AAC.1